MTNLEELKQLALAATSGRWNSAYHNRTDTWAITFEKHGCDTVNDEENIIARAMDGSSKYSTDFDYIAEANPATILKLIERIEKLEAALRHYEIAHYCKICGCNCVGDKIASEVLNEKI